MAVYDKQGNRHHSASRAKLSDDLSGKKGSNPAESKSDTGGGANNSGGGSKTEQDEGDVSHLPIADVVEKHGPAHKVEIEHDHKGGSHKKTSHHGKNTHTSEHSSAKEAHEAGMQAVGVTPGDEQETPDQANGEAGGEAMAGAAPSGGGGGGIPGMSS